MTSIGNDNDDDDDVVMTTTTTMNNNVVGDDEIDDNGHHHHPSSRRDTHPPNKKRRSSIDTDVLNQFKGLSANSASTTTTTVAQKTGGVGPPSGAAAAAAAAGSGGSGAKNNSTLNMYYGNAMGSINDFDYTTEHTMTLNKPRTYISRLVTKFKSSLVALHARNISDWKLECMSIFIHECMSNISRNYHSVEHVFEICNELSKDRNKDTEQGTKNTITTQEYYESIGILSALFHDCIYTNVDGGLTQNQMDVLGK